MSKSSNNVNSPTTMKWIHVKSVRAHTHDVRALTVAVPIVEEGLLESSLLLIFFVIYSVKIVLASLDELIMQNRKVLWD